MSIYVLTIWMPFYLQHFLHLPLAQANLMNTFTLCTVIPLCLGVGLLAQYIGYKKSVENFLSQSSSPVLRQEAEYAMARKKRIEKKKTKAPSESKALNVIMGTLWCIALVACPFFLVIFIDFKNWKLRRINLFSGWTPSKSSSLGEMIDSNRQSAMRVGTIAYYTYGPGARRRI